MTLSDQVHLYVELTKKKRVLDAQLKQLNGTLRTMESAIVEAFGQNGLQNVKTAEGDTAYLRHEIWASVDTEQPHWQEMFRDAGWGWLIKETVNRSTLSATVRELPLDDDGAPVLPEPVIPCIKIDEAYRIGVRSS